jgi:NAD(P)-dependent dehydrogenase (short-subunit alcohol dehydrogenase family)
MDLKLAGKRALITGGSKGIGLACAQGLAAEGVHLAIAARDVSTLKEVTKQLRSGYDIEVTSHSCDLARPEHQSALVDVVGDIDLLINNAGAVPGGTIDAVSEKEWRAAWDLKVFGYINLCRLVMPQMVERGSGVIVNIIGSAADRPRPDYIAGAAGNSALVGFTTALGSSSLSAGVRVVGINPGLTVTDRLEDLLRESATRKLGDPDRWEELIPTDPIPATAEQVADVALFLASERAGHISGTTITVDGGASAR